LDKVKSNYTKKATELNWNDSAQNLNFKLTMSLEGIILGLTLGAINAPGLEGKI